MRYTPWRITVRPRPSLRRGLLMQSSRVTRSLSLRRTHFCPSGRYWRSTKIDAAVRQHPRRVAVSPLFSGTALKGPAAEVMSGIGLAAGTRGILEAYRGLIDDLFIDHGDAPDTALGPEFDVAIHAGDTLLSGEDDGATFAAQIIETVTA